ncbi:cell division protein ZapA [Lichenihabitans sp. PAMC28606]|uniref:cell division protein ZapA n=1 Tax=Lichenihabitans sp. PAMC28606 TaxID=2880932 RepID=UPI001D0A016E|nr:cell division protein ZapA [Lichenihabitans sp. PAMC28606]UDL93236.1 cell division protein ZapA [Lichenihabitans sp. PAMC28606]
MPQVSVTIAGRLYRMACGEGEEEHLQGLARRLDGKITDLRAHFGEIGDQRITVMAAITMADDLSEAERRIAALEADVAEYQREREAGAASIEAIGDRVAATLDDAAARIDKIAGSLNAPRG